MTNYCIKCNSCTKSYNYENPVFPDGKIEYRCTLFKAESNLVTGEPKYELCINIRNTDSKCGKNGKYFVKRSIFSFL